MKELYLLSGLGADKRVFDFIDLSGYKPIFIQWIEPLINETIQNYARRLLKQITTTTPIIIGVSFGGLISIEIGKLIKAEKIIIISSVKTTYEIPIYFKLIGKLKLHKLMPTKIFKKTNSLTFWFFGTKNKMEKELLIKIIEETDIIFLRWAIDKIVNWQNYTLLLNTIHIHGTNDRILPIHIADFKIEKGGHLMIVNKADEISQIIRNELINI